jgi:hypothetical protein
MNARHKNLTKLADTRDCILVEDICGLECNCSFAVLVGFSWGLNNLI